MDIIRALGTDFLGDRGRLTCNEYLALIHNRINPDYLGFFQLKDSLTYFFTERKSEREAGGKAQMGCKHQATLWFEPFEKCCE